MNMIDESLVKITRELDTLRGKDAREMNARREELYDQLRLIGATAAFFGGYDAMKKLHDAAERLVGDTNEVGFYLNRAWDGIGGWAS